MRYHLRIGIFGQLLLAFLLVALLPLALFWRFEQARVVEAGSERAHTLLHSFSERVVQQVDDWTDLNLTTLQIAAQLPAIRSMDASRQQPVLDALAQHLPWSYLVHTAGIDGVNVARSDRAAPVDYTFRRYHRDVVAGQPYSVEVDIGRTSRRPAFLLGVPIPGNDGAVAGVLIEAATLDEVTGAVGSARFGRTGFAFLMSDDGRLMAHPFEALHAELMDYSAHPAYAAAQSGHSGIVEYEHDGIARMAAIHRTRHGWIAVTQQDVAESLEAMHAANRFGLVLLGLTAALAALLSPVVARGFARPPTELARVLAVIAGGDLSARMRGRYHGTFAQLQRDANATIDALAGSIRQIEISRELLRATLEHLPQGVSVVDAELRLIAWNRRYLEIFDYPEGLVRKGVPVEALMRCNLRRGLMGSGDGEQEIRRRLQHLRSDRHHVHERELPDGTVLEIRGSPLPGTGYVTSFSDVTAYKRTETALRTLTETLERRVAERTRALESATAEAHRANRAKSRFLAAAVHDLAQPITAARLYITALKSDLAGGKGSEVADRAEATLAAVEDVFAGLMDISQLESGKLAIRIEDVALAPLFESLQSEFALVAQERGLRLRCVPTEEVVRSDPALLRRVLQNYLSNALRYTRSGAVMLACRRHGDARRIEVRDSGPGIPSDKTAEIFDEFHRLPDSAGEAGAGLGLAIVRNIARSLDHTFGVHSRPGNGSVFFIVLPAASGQVHRAPAPTAPAADGGELQGLHVWCIDDDRNVRDAARALLERWGCTVTLCASVAEALQRARRAPPPDLLLLDYRLEDGTGMDLLPRLDRLWECQVPALLVTGEQPSALPPQAHTRTRVLAKPLQADTLRAALLQAVHRPSV